MLGRISTISVVTFLGLVLAAWTLDTNSVFVVLLHVFDISICKRKYNFNFMRVTFYTKTIYIKQLKEKNTTVSY